MLGLANREKFRGYEHPEIDFWASIVAGIEVYPGRCSRHCSERLSRPRLKSGTLEGAVWVEREH